jgi:hypothetical protein
MLRLPWDVASTINLIPVDRRLRAPLTHCFDTRVVCVPPHVNVPATDLICPVFAGKGGLNRFPVGMAEEQATEA